ncbi:MAG TPA: Holliday junction resolvase RuvX [Coriobacteriia bacterium]|nr:Holliday junction resolvase RuvX [Coriobacteriia bacterium]
MRVLGLDIGGTRVGVAVSDPLGIIASPLAVLDARDLMRDPAPLARLAEDYEAECLVVGLPLTLAGDEGPQAAETRTHAERLGAKLGLAVEYHDERLSTAEARKRMREAGLSDKDQRGSLDKVAAAIVLQRWLDARRVRSREDA